MVARIGGDEFCVLLTRDEDVDAQAALARLDGALAERNAGSDLPAPIGLSAGMAAFDPATPVTIAELLAEADRAMYERKSRRVAVRSG